MVFYYKNESHSDFLMVMLAFACQEIRSLESSTLKYYSNIFSFGIGRSSFPFHLYVRNCNFRMIMSCFTQVWTGLWYLRPPSVSTGVAAMSGCWGLNCSVMTSLVSLSKMWLHCFALTPHREVHQISLVLTVIARQQHHGVWGAQALDLELWGQQKVEFKMF